jgi:DNA integrity scanning protein DisA with diadenylate cyclase activity
MMALLFIIVPMPILSVNTKITSYVSKPLKKVVEFFNGKDYYDYKHVIENVQKTVEIFELEDKVALAKLKNIVREALEKLPEIIKQNIRIHDFYFELISSQKMISLWQN